MKYKIIDQKGLNFLTFTVVDWVDVFTRKEYKDIIIDSLKYCQQQKGLVIYAYVIMTNHIHLIAETDGRLNLSDVVRDFKSFTGLALLKAIEDNPKESRREWLMHRFKWNAQSHPSKNRLHQFWDSDNHPIMLYSPDVIWQKINYIHRNPVATGIVLKPEEYLYSSAKNYAGEKNCLLDVVTMEFSG